MDGWCGFIIFLGRVGIGVGGMGGWENLIDFMQN